MTQPGLDALAKEKALVSWLWRHGRVAIGFSGGVDSAYLAAVTVETLGPDDCLALIGRSDSLAGREEDHALSVARQIGIPNLEIETGELSDPRYAANPANRCYFCKSVLWLALKPVARTRGFETLVDGTNADDLHDYRPGSRAALEQAVLSPLAQVGLTKAEIRERTRVRGWPWWSRPASPCLASRLPYGTAVTPERLRQVERAEAALRDLGITGNIRVRHHGELARVELDSELVSRWSGAPEFAVLERAVIDAGFLKVELDPRGFRSGSLNVLDAGVPGGRATLSGH
jgi:pyridinium-3,5-biscarboxylic acid mononucleotide sulfurtransferase